MTARTIGSVALGGAAGALVRGGLLDALQGQQSAVLLAINVVGSFLLGLLVVRLVDSPTVFAAAGTGFCGALTSMSTFAVDIAQRLQAGQVASALVLGLLTLGLTVAGGMAGLRIGEPT